MHFECNSLGRMDDCGALHDLVPFVQFKKREKHPWRSVTFTKVAGYSNFIYFNWIYLNCTNSTKSRKASWILYLSISIYWLLIQMSQAAFVSAGLSTWHICSKNEVIINIITTKSENFVKRLMVIMEPRSCPWPWTKFLGIPRRIPGQLV